jgi:hypothetical protein
MDDLGSLTHRYTLVIFCVLKIATSASVHINTLMVTTVTVPFLQLESDETVVNGSGNQELKSPP